MSKILVVEDEKILREVYETVLLIEGFEVETAEDGQDGLDKLPNFQPDLILLDILMPRVDGLQFLERAKIKKNYPKTKVLAFSNLSDQHKLDLMRDMGATSYVLKSSLTPKQLVAIINKLLHS